MWLDLCQPDPWFSQKRARYFTVTAREAKKMSFWEELLRYFGKRDLVAREASPKSSFWEELLRYFGKRDLVDAGEKAKRESWWDKLQPLLKYWW